MIKKIISPFKNLNILYKIFLILSFLIILFSSLLNLYEKRGAIKFKVYNFFDINLGEDASYSNIPEKDVYWANQIMKGGYILHFRHAERDKWIDVTMYDSLESDVHNNGQDNSRYAENDYFDQAVCLNKRGKIQAMAMGEHLKNIKFPIGEVVSSVSCRSRQTAELAFNGYDSLHRILVHIGPYNEIRENRSKNLINFYQSLKIEKNKNTLVSAHNSVISCEILMNKNCPWDFSLEEGGFYIISKSNSGLVLEHEFNNFVDFIRVFYKR